MLTDYEYLENGFGLGGYRKPKKVIQESDMSL